MGQQQPIRVGPRRIQQTIRVGQRHVQQTIIVGRDVFSNQDGAVVCSATKKGGAEKCSEINKAGETRVGTEAFSVTKTVPWCVQQPKRVGHSRVQKPMRV